MRRRARLIGIGVTEVVGDSLRDIVSEPVSENFFNITTFAALVLAAEDISESVRSTQFKKQ